jgi:flagellar basal-body rod protein FlgG
LAITVDGRVTVKLAGGDDAIEIGRIELYRFPNQAGLEAVGNNMFKVSNASGIAMPGRPGFEDMGTLQHKFLEMSNVSVVNEMVQMIVAQRAYEFNSKAIQTSDSMLSTAANLKR